MRSRRATASTATATRACCCRSERPAQRRQNGANTPCVQRPLRLDCYRRLRLAGFPHPTKLLHSIVKIGGDVQALALCPDFERGSWRHKQLADHLFDWLPDVALRPRERELLLYEANKTLARSCRRLFDTEDATKRGEIGEILLHAACRQEFGTAPFVARLFYKMRSNDSVTSVDVVHVLYNEKQDGLELWLGEAKLYDNVQQAKYKALDSIRPLWNDEFLSEMKALIGPKIESNAPYEHELSLLFAEETSLDQIVRRLVIPICLAADFDPTKAAKERTTEYIKAVGDQLNDLVGYFQERVPVEVSFVVIFVPMDCKKSLEIRFNSKVQSHL